MPKKTVETTHLRLRVRKDMLKQLEKAADNDGRTLSDEITRRLERSLIAESAATETADIARLASEKLMADITSRMLILEEIMRRDLSERTVNQLKDDLAKGELNVKSITRRLLEEEWNRIKAADTGRTQPRAPEKRKA